ncbi:MAG: hypothetical protein GY778_22280 [bacterium]|nr:hypothetical protein [bacterium]
MLVVLVQSASITRSGFGLQRVSERGNRPVLRMAQAYHPIVAQWGFEHLGCFDCNSVPPGKIAAWRLNDHPVFVAAYLIGNQQAIDIVSEFAYGIALTASNTASGALYPDRPGCFNQFFPGAAFEVLWREHCEADEYLVHHGGAQPGDPEIAFETAFVKGVQGQMKYVYTIRLWYARVMGWFVAMTLKKRGHLNMGIAEQHQAGLITLPNEPDFWIFDPDAV